MPRPRAIGTSEAERTLAHRLGARVDRIRQFKTKLGVSPYRVYLVWTRAGGRERGEGEETELKRIEILPAPKVTDLNAVSITAMAAGTIPMGSIRITEVSVKLSQKTLTGELILDGVAPNDVPKYNFFYEVQLDERYGATQDKTKYRLSAVPFLDAENVQWIATLERIEDVTNPEDVDD